MAATRRAHRVAWGTVKNGFEKVGGLWEPKPEPGPSDPRSLAPPDAKIAGAGEKFGGVDIPHPPGPSASSARVRSLSMSRRR